MNQSAQIRKFRSWPPHYTSSLSQLPGTLYLKRQRIAFQGTVPLIPIQTNTYAQTFVQSASTKTTHVLQKLVSLSVLTLVFAVWDCRYSKLLPSPRPFRLTPLASRLTTYSPVFPRNGPTLPPHSCAHNPDSRPQEGRIEHYILSCIHILLG